MTLWRPSEFKEEYTKKLEEFFNIDASFFKDIVTTGKNEYEKIEPKEFASNLPTLQKFAYDIKVNRDTILEWSNQGKDPKYDKEDKELKQDFSVAYTRAKDIQESIWLENSLKSLYNPQFAIFLWKNVFGYKDKTETDVKHSWEIKNPSNVISALTGIRDKIVQK